MVVAVAAQSFLEKEIDMVASTLFTIFGLGALCWIMFNLAVYALPFAIGLTTGLYLYETGQGVFLSVFLGLFVGGFFAALGEFAFERIRSDPIKLAIGLMYAVPAGIAGFHAAKGLAEFGGSSGLTITLGSASEQLPTSTLVAQVADQAALRGVLCKLWDLNLALISVHHRGGGKQEHQNE